MFNFNIFKFQNNRVNGLKQTEYHTQGTAQFWASDGKLFYDFMECCEYQQKVNAGLQELYRYQR